MLLAAKQNAPRYSANRSGSATVCGQPEVVPEVSAALRRERRKICAGWLGHLALGSPGLRHAERAVGCRPSAVSSAGPPLLQRSRILCRCKLCDKLLHGVPFFRDTCLGTHIIQRLRTPFHFGCGSAALSLCGGGSAIDASPRESSAVRHALSGASASPEPPGSIDDMTGALIAPALHGSKS